jgi:phosphopentomutase
MRALLIILDSAGVGDAADAARYGDAGANTLGHIFERVPWIDLPTLWSLGLGQILGWESTTPPQASFGRMEEKSAGKDSTTGHWELAGVVLDEPFAVYPRFDDALVSAIENEAGVSFIGHLPASGTAIINRLGEEHMKTGRPILYTSADSVLQIAAHEEVIAPQRLYEICRIARRHADAYRIGRVIARPFVGKAGNFHRTAGRHDFSIRPPRTVLDAIREAGWEVVGIGKTSDLFAGEGITQSLPTDFNAEGMRKIEEIWAEGGEGLVFANLVDFDTLYGHRRDAEGYAGALMEFDRWLARFLPQVSEEDLLIITADHGNDPTFKGTDHTREQVPLMVRWRGRREDLGLRHSFADVAATLGAFFGLPEPWQEGRSFFTFNSGYKPTHDQISAASARRASPGGRDHRGTDAGGSEPPGSGAGGEPRAAPVAPAHPGDLLQPGGKGAANGRAVVRKRQAPATDQGKPG